MVRSWCDFTNEGAAKIRFDTQDCVYDIAWNESHEFVSRGIGGHLAYEQEPSDGSVWERCFKAL